jgi:hypothetical protein
MYGRLHSVCPQHRLLFIVTMNAPSMLASPVKDNVFIITQNLFPASRDEIVVSMGVASLFFLSKAAYGNHVLRPGVQAPLGNFILVTVGPCILSVHMTQKLVIPLSLFALHHSDDHDCC